MVELRVSLRLHSSRCHRTCLLDLGRRHGSKTKRERCSRYRAKTRPRRLPSPCSDVCAGARPEHVACAARRSRSRHSYTSGMEHSPTSATGTGWEGTRTSASGGTVRGQYDPDESPSPGALRRVGRSWLNQRTLLRPARTARRYATGRQMPEASEALTRTSPDCLGNTSVPGDCTHPCGARSGARVVQLGS